MTSRAHRWMGWLVPIVLGGCGGEVVVEGTTTSSTGGAGCQSHDDCPSGTLCNFATGECARACADLCEACPSGEVCDACGTSSCPTCKDCAPICVPVGPGTSPCDDHTDCAEDELCVFEFGGAPNTCRPKCDSIQCTDDKFCESGVTLNERCGMVLREACSP